MQFWLCDTSNNPKQDIQFSTFPKDCHYLKRVPKKSCEDGTDKGCGPIDKRDEGKWVMYVGLDTDCYNCRLVHGMQKSTNVVLVLL